MGARWSTNWGAAVLSALLGVLLFASVSGSALAAPGAPVVEREWSSGVGITTATIDAQIDPAESDTTYHFEYDTSEYASAASHGTSVPVPDTDIGITATAVSQPLTDLQAGTTYHYRVVATNANGTTDGQDRVFITATAPTTAATDTCPNAQLRAGSLSAGLPDCRAYEMVSPLDKNGTNVEASGNTVAASFSGERVAYAGRAGFADTTGSGVLGMVQYVASRSVGGWSTEAVTPAPALDAWQALVGATDIAVFSSELGAGVVGAYDLPQVSNDAPKAENLYEETFSTKRLEAITTPLGSGRPGLFDFLGNSIRGASSDLGVVTFETGVSMLPEADGTSNQELYAWEHGTLKLAGVLPNGSVPSGGSGSPRSGEEDLFKLELVRRDTVSSDGSRVLFVSPTDGSAASQLYMRKNGSSTVWVSRSEASTPNPEPLNVKFAAASSDLTKVLFVTNDRLTDSDPGGAGLGLYLYTDSADAETESNLTFIARIQPAGEPFFKMSDDGSRIYFNSGSAPGLPGEGGIYLWDKGVVHVVADTPLKGILTTEGSYGRDTERVSPDGRVFAFLAEKDLGVGDTGKPLDKPGEGIRNSFTAMYVYDESDERLRCVSCPSSGASMTSDVELNPHATGNVPEVVLPVRLHFLSNDGRYVFFSTADALVPQDTNGLYDVYEYDTETGKVALLSSGTGDVGSWFQDASASGRDVFFVTGQSLTGWDTDTLIDLYDARVDGGLSEPPPAPVSCVGDACQGIPSAVPSFNTASGFNGRGNAVSKLVVKAKQKAKPKKRRRKGKHGKKAKRPRKRGRSSAALSVRGNR